MMSVKEYANDTSSSVAEILKKCSELGINVKSATDTLSEDDIIILDNTMNLISTASDTSLEEEDVIDEAVELAKKYSTEDSSSFINGILAKVVYELGIK